MKRAIGQVTQGRRAHVCLLVYALGVYLQVQRQAHAQPRIPPPTLKGLLAEDLVAKARVRWSKTEDGETVWVQIGGGMAERKNQRWSPEPARLPFDLDQNQRLDKAIKAARLGPPTTRAATGNDARTLEILGRGPDGWMVVGTWSLPLSQWRRRHAAVLNILEPLFAVQADVWTTPRPAR